MNAVSPSRDVVVLGGGPAGAAAALALTRRGFSVAILERSSYEGARFGETVPGSVVEPLARLGVWDRFLATEPQPAPGIVAVWGRDEPFENDFIFSSYGSGWHLDRRRFDRMLAEEAAGAGAAVHRDTRLEACERDSQGHWQVRGRTRGESFAITASWVVDATGQVAWLARRQGSQRLVTDRLVAMVSFATQAASATEFTALEALADGWWYAAPLPSGRWVAGFFTDSDLFPHCSSERRRFWFERWRRTSLISGLFPEVDGTKPIHVVSAASRTLDRVTGRGWLAVGDAARSYDPLSGQGITKALESALAAAEAIAASSAGDAMALDRFAHDADREWQRYRAEHAAHYARERRWPYSVFWRRRRC